MKTVGYKLKCSSKVKFSSQGLSLRVKHTNSTRGPSQGTNRTIGIDFGGAKPELVELPTVMSTLDWRKGYMDILVNMVQ